MHKLTRAPWRALALGAVLGVAGCAQPASVPSQPFRSPGAPIWSNAQLDAAQLVGRWQQSAAFGPETGTCRPGGAEIGGTAAALTLAARLCLGGKEMRFAGPLSATGPGRFRAGDQDWWVIWVDTNYRTLAIGTPTGAFGFILNRGGALPPDRLRAAREIFDFNGYDTARLQAF